jgi:hypothetical protein
VLLINTHTENQNENNLAFWDARTQTEPGVNLLTFEWSIGRHKFIEKSDLVIQQHNQNWVTDINPDHMNLHIRRHLKEGHNYISFDCLYEDEGFSFHWQRQLYVAPKSQELKGVDTFKSPHDCLIGLRFRLNPLFLIHPEHDNFFIQLPIFNAGKSSVESQKWLFRNIGSDDVLTSNSEDDQKIILLMKKCDKNISQTIKWSYNQINTFDHD